MSVNKTENDAPPLTWEEVRRRSAGKVNGLSFYCMMCWLHYMDIGYACSTHTLASESEARSKAITALMHMAFRT